MRFMPLAGFVLNFHLEANSSILSALGLYSVDRLCCSHSFQASASQDFPHFQQFIFPRYCQWKRTLLSISNIPLPTSSLKLLRHQDISMDRSPPGVDPGWNNPQLFRTLGRVPSPVNLDPQAPTMETYSTVHSLPHPNKGYSTVGASMAHQESGFLPLQSSAMQHPSISNENFDPYVNAASHGVITPPTVASQDKPSSILRRSRGKQNSLPHLRTPPSVYRQVRYLSPNGSIRFSDIRKVVPNTMAMGAAPSSDKEATNVPIVANPTTPVVSTSYSFIDSIPASINLKDPFEVPQPHAIKLDWTRVDQELKDLAVRLGIQLYTGPDVPHAIFPTEQKHVVNDTLNWNIKFLRQVVGFEMDEIADILNALITFKGLDPRSITEAVVNSRWGRNAKKVAEVQQDILFDKEKCKKAAAKKRKRHTVERRQHKKRKISRKIDEENEEDEEYEEGNPSLLALTSTFTAEDDVIVRSLFLRKIRELCPLLTVDINTECDKVFTKEQVMDRMDRLFPH
jgi:hypothetical protein